MNQSTVRVLLVLGMAFVFSSQAAEEGKPITLSGTIDTVFQKGNAILFRPGQSKELREIQLTEQCRITDANGKVVAHEKVKQGQKVTISFIPNQRPIAQLKREIASRETTTPAPASPRVVDDDVVTGVLEFDATIKKICVRNAQTGRLMVFQVDGTTTIAKLGGETIPKDSLDTGRTVTILFDKNTRYASHVICGQPKPPTPSVPFSTYEPLSATSQTQSPSASASSNRYDPNTDVAGALRLGGKVVTGGWKLFGDFLNDPGKGSSTSPGRSWTTLEDRPNGKSVIVRHYSPRPGITYSTEELPNGKNVTTTRYE